MTFNVNSIRLAAKRMSKAQKDFFSAQDIHFITETRLGHVLIQEIPGLDLSEFHIFNSEFPIGDNNEGLGRNGVALLISKHSFQEEPQAVTTTFPGWSVQEMEGRFAEVHVGKLALLCIYFPNASRDRDDRIPYKEQFNAAVLLRVRTLKKAGFSIIMGGDFNLAFENKDIHSRMIKEISSGFRPSERQFFRELLNSGMVDTFRHCHPNTNAAYTTWMWGPKNRVGARYDYILTTTDLRIKGANHHNTWEVSDHIPVTASIEIDFAILEGTGADDKECFRNQVQKEAVPKCFRRQKSPQEDSITHEKDSVPIAATFGARMAKGSKENFKKEFIFHCKKKRYEVTEYRAESIKGVSFIPVSSMPPKMGAEVHQITDLYLREDERVLGVSFESAQMRRETVDNLEKSVYALRGNQGLSPNEMEIIRYELGEFMERTENKEDATRAYQYLARCEAEENRIPTREQASSMGTKYKPVGKKMKPVPVGESEQSQNPPKDAPEDHHEGLKRGTRPKEFTDQQLDDLLKSASNEGRWNEKSMTYLRGTLSHYRDAFSYNSSEMGRLNPDMIAPVEIETVEHIPWETRMRPIPPALLPKLLAFLDEKIRDGIVEQSASSYSSPWFVVLKKDGSLRFIQDLQLLNRVSVRDAGVPPRRDEVVEEVAGHLAYIAADLRSMYDQIPLAIRSRDKTAIRTPRGLLQMVGLPQGWTTSVSKAQSRATIVFYLEGKIKVFVDDITGYTGRPPDHGGLGIEALDENGVQLVMKEVCTILSYMCRRAILYGLTFHHLKTHIAVSSTVVLGVVVDKDGRHVDPTKVNALLKFPVPTGISTLRSLLGTLSVFRAWIQNFSRLAEPLYRLIRKGVQWEWGLEQKDSVRILVNLISSAPVLAPTDYSKMLYLETDSSIIGDGALLYQEIDGLIHLVACYSGLHNQYERNYSQIKLELLGLLRNLHRAHYHLHGAEFVTLRVDARSLIGMINNPGGLDPIMLRWCLFIKAHNFILEFKPKSKADGLSRQYTVPVEESIALAENDTQAVEAAIDRRMDCAVVMSNNRVGDGPAEFEGFMPEYPFQEDSYTDSPKYLQIGRYLQKAVFPENFENSEKAALTKKAADYFLANGILFRRMGKREPTRVLGLYSDREAVLETFHDDIGHPSDQRSYDTAKISYFWDTMRADFRTYILLCKECQFRSRYREAEKVRPSKAVSLILVFWQIDLIHMPLSRSGYRYILQSTCMSTQYWLAKAFKKKNFSTYVKYLKDQVFYVFGFPLLLHVDGGEFASAEASQLAEEFGVKVEVITPHNHQALGQVERAHRPLKDALSKVTGGGISDWQPLLAPMVFGANTTVKSLGESSHYLVYGQDPSFQLSIPLRSFTTINWGPLMTPIELLAARCRVLASLEVDREKFWEALTKMRETSAFHWNRKHDGKIRKRPLEPGELVLLVDSAIDDQHGRALDYFYRGPFVIVEARTGGTYLLRELDGAVFRRAVSGNRLKKFVHQHDQSRGIFFEKSSEGIAAESVALGLAVSPATVSVPHVHILKTGDHVAELESRITRSERLLGRLHQDQRLSARTPTSLRLVLGL